MFLVVFGSVFAAELGDKTQLATLLFAADGELNRWLVFAAASLALILTSAIGVLAGHLVSEWINPRVVSYAAGLLFIAIGLWMLIRA